MPVSHLRSVRKKIKAPRPRNYKLGDRPGFLSLSPEFYTWVEKGAYALFLFDSFTDGFMHVVDLGAGALLAYVCKVANGYYLRFAGDGQLPREFREDEVKILGQVYYVCVSVEPPVYWEMSDMRREEAENVYERPLLKVNSQ